MVLVGVGVKVGVLVGVEVGVDVGVLVKAQPVAGINSTACISALLDPPML